MSDQSNATPARPAKWGRFRIFVLVGASGIALLLLGFREVLIHRVTGWAVLDNDAPSTEALQDFIDSAPDPDAARLAAWRTGKIVHRQVAMRSLAALPANGDVLTPELEDMLLTGALDPDLNVREAAFPTLQLRNQPLLPVVAAEQLRDPDPEIRLLGLKYLKPAPAKQGLPLAAQHIDDPDLRVAGMAIKLMQNWAEEDFDIKLVDTVLVTDLKTGRKDFKPEGIARVQAAADRARNWWAHHAKDYPPSLTPLPPRVKALVSPLSAGDFALTTLDGRDVRLSDLRGRTVLLNFWTTWCTSCLLEIPALIELQERHGDALVILGVSLDAVPDSHGHDGGHPSPGTSGSQDHGHDEVGHEHDDEDHDHDHEHAHDDDAGHDAESHGDGEHSEVSLARIRTKVERFAKRLGVNYPILVDEHNTVGGRYRGGELPTTLIIDQEGNIRRRFVGARTLPVFEAMIAEAKRPPNREQNGAGE